MSGPATESSTSTASIEEFWKRVQSVNPFQVNRVSSPSDFEAPGAMTGADVASIHEPEFRRLTDLAEQVTTSGRAVGAVVMGPAGVGKSHLLARFSKWARNEERACFVYLHNIQVRAEAIPRYLLKSIVAALTQDRSRQLDRSLLYRVFEAAFQSAGRKGGIPVLRRSELSATGELLANCFGIDPLERQAFHVIVRFFYFAANLKLAREKGSVPPKTEKLANHAIQWLMGEPLDKEDASELDLTARPGEDVVALSDAHDIEQVIVTLCRLAKTTGKPVIVCLDQCDNMGLNETQATARFLHSLLDHGDNLMVAVCGIQQSLEALRDRGIISEAAWDRVAEHKIVLKAISKPEGAEIITTRIGQFRDPFRHSPQVSGLLERDPLFPLSKAWLFRTIQNLNDPRPRELITLSRDAWTTLAQKLGADGPAKWLNGWPHLEDAVSALPIRPKEELIDEKVDAKMEEHIRNRSLDHGAWPADEGNMLQLTYSLLLDCVNTDHGYTLESVLPTDASRKATHWLVVRERRPSDNKVVQSIVAFITETSATSVTAKLRNLLEQDDVEHRVLVTDSERRPLKLKAKGKEYYQQLVSLGSSRFRHIQLSFHEVAQLDALLEVVGLARSGDLEVTPRPGENIGVSVSEVVASHHRKNRYRQHPLLREFLTEEETESTFTPEALEPEQVAQFIVDQLVFHTGSTSKELTERFLAERESLIEFTAAHNQFKDVAEELHRKGNVVARPFDDQLWITFLRVLS